MTGPGEYVPDVTEGITRVEDLPKPRIERHSRNWQARPCRRCGHRAGRYGVGSRTLHDLGDARADRPVDLDLSNRALDREFPGRRHRKKSRTCCQFVDGTTQSFWISESPKQHVRVE